MLSRILQPIWTAWKRRALPDSFLADNQTVREAVLLGTSRCGLPSWRAKLDDRTVKVYRCHSSSQAALIQSICNDPALQEFFPPCLARHDDLLVVSWVEGTSPSKSEFRTRPELLQRTGKFQALLHSHGPPEDLKSAGDSDLSYLDYLTDRWRKYQSIWPMQDVLATLTGEIRGDTRIGPLRLSHPDVTPANLVFDPNGNFRLVDNELLSANNYPLVDLLNTHRALGSRCPQSVLHRYLRAYLAGGGDLTGFVEHPSFFVAVWDLRQLGSLLQDGRIDEAVHLGGKVSAERRPEHPLIEAARAILGL